MANIPVNFGSSSTALAAKREAARLAPAAERLLILLDHSGSMSRYMEGANGSRLDASKRAVEGFLAKCSPAHSAVGLVAFGDMDRPTRMIAPPLQEYTRLRIALARLEPEGGTPMGEALKVARADRPTRCILVSDGLPDSSSEALREAAHFTNARIPVDTVFIGNAGEDGEAFLKKLAELTGGFAFTAADFATYERALGLLEARARLQLTHG